MTTTAQMIQRMAENAAALANRDADVFGAHLDDVRLLRRREFMVTRYGADFLVDGRTVDGATLRALADRERRLMGEAARAAASPVDSARINARMAPEPSAPRRRPASRRRRASTVCVCGGCIPAGEVLAIVDALKRLLEQVARTTNA